MQIHTQQPAPHKQTEINLDKLVPVFSLGCCSCSVRPLQFAFAGYCGANALCCGEGLVNRIEPTLYSLTLICDSGLKTQAATLQRVAVVYALNSECRYQLTAEEQYLSL
jgi:hypothetical protein